MIPSAEMKVEPNVCYVQGAVQEPVYAEIESTVKTKTNDAYHSTQSLQDFVIARELSHSSPLRNSTE